MNNLSEKEMNKPVKESAFHKKISSPVFYNLKLSKDLVRKLFKDFKKNYKNNKLVFQFYYPAESKDGSPTLGAYAMRSKNQVINPKHICTPKLLEYGDKSSEPLTGRAQFLGDQQVNIAKLKKLIEDSNKPDPEVYDHLVFSAKFNNQNPHIYYEISVHPSNSFNAKPINTDPSPPAPAS
jgi:hypothetical protein